MRLGGTRILRHRGREHTTMYRILRGGLVRVFRVERQNLDAAGDVFPIAPAVTAVGR